MKLPIFFAIAVLPNISVTAHADLVKGMFKGVIIDGTIKNTVTNETTKEDEQSLAGKEVTGDFWYSTRVLSKGHGLAGPDDAFYSDWGDDDNTEWVNITYTIDGITYELNENTHAPNKINRNDIVNVRDYPQKKGLRFRDIGDIEGVGREFSALTIIGADKNIVSQRGLKQSYTWERPTATQNCDDVCSDLYAYQYHYGDDGTVASSVTLSADITSISFYIEDEKGDLGIAPIDEKTLTAFVLDKGWSGAWNYLCLDDNCAPAERVDGYYQREIPATKGKTYQVEMKVQDDAVGQVTFSSQVPFTDKENSIESLLGDACDQFGIAYVSDHLMAVYHGITKRHNDTPWTARWHYLCVNGDCGQGLNNGRYYVKVFPATIDKEYAISFRVQDDIAGQYVAEKVMNYLKTDCTLPDMMNK